MSAFQMNYAYAFAGGVLVDRVVGFIPSLIITGVLLYTTNSPILSVKNVDNYKNTVIEMIKNIVNK